MSDHDEEAERQDGDASANNEPDTTKVKANFLPPLPYEHAMASERHVQEAHALSTKRKSKAMYRRLWWVFLSWTFRRVSVPHPHIFISLDN